MSDQPNLPWESAGIKKVIEDFDGYVADIRQIDIVIVPDGGNDSGNDRDIHG